MNPVNFAIFTFCIAVVIVTASEDWSYEGENGPSHWCHKFPVCCKSRQSPVNFDTNTVKLDHIPAIQFHHYDRQPEAIRVQNNGHSIYIYVNQSQNMPMINDGGLGSNFVMAQFHFHWPAEHTVDGERDALELHVVHFNTRYGDLATAVKNRDGVAVTGVLFEITKEENQALGSIIKTLPKVKYGKDDAMMNTEGFSMLDMMPSSTQGFYRYYGSLTTPGCDEVVTWTVFDTKSFLSQRQLDVFKSLKANMKGEDEVSMNGNYRPVQPLKGRKVHRRMVSAASIPSISLLAILTAFTMTCSRNYHKLYMM